MINLLRTIIESAQSEDFSLKSIDPREPANNEAEDNALRNEAYERAVISVKTSYTEHQKYIHEICSNLRYDLLKIGDFNVSEYSIEIHPLAINPSLNNKLFTWVDEYIDRDMYISKANGAELSTSDAILNDFKFFLNQKMTYGTTGSDPRSLDFYTGSPIRATIPVCIIRPNIEIAINNICETNDDLYHIYKLVTNKLVNCKCPMAIESLARIYDYAAKVALVLVGAYSEAAVELIALAKKCTSLPMTEAVDQSKESVNQYISEIDNLINDIRKFYDTFEYKEIIIPRKKKVGKMYDYVLGALQRKYTLRIPIYKVEGVSKDVKDIVEHKFIDKLENITKKYPNFVIMSPNWDDEDDMFIYITLREPFGDSDDRNDRVKQVQNEAALSADQRNKLKDYEFGLPESRRYPLNDEKRIRKAIQFFGFCKSDEKETLAKNIVRRIIELNLVGQVSISEKHPNKKYFPEWMLNTYKPDLEIKGNKYEIYVDGKKVDFGTLEDHSYEDDTTVVNESGILY